MGAVMEGSGRRLHGFDTALLRPAGEGAEAGGSTSNAESPQEGRGEEGP